VADWKLDGTSRARKIMPTHLCSSVLGGSLACTQLSFAISLSSISSVVSTSIAVCTGAHNA
jgi:hypothetical protein